LYVETLDAVLREALDRAGFSANEVTLVLPHNVNRLSWRQVADSMGIPLERIFLDNVAKLGHCFGADPFINLSDARSAGKVRPGDIVLLATAGLGATFAAMVVRVGEGQARKGHTR
jgi:3-oxoacyl-[acyl-carrier-protein] synthase-3